MLSMSRVVRRVILVAAAAGVLGVLFAWPGGAAPDKGPRTCLSIGLPVSGPGAGVSTVGCIPPAPKANPVPPPTVPPPPPPPPATPRPVPPAVPAQVTQPLVVAVTPPPTTSPTTSPPATPPRTTTRGAPMPVAAPAPPVSVAAEVDKQRRWGLTALVLLIGGGAAATRMRSARNR